jgi:hypothetical protein
MLGIGYLHLKDGAPDPQLIKAGGGFSLAAAIMAWYNALAGIADTSNRYVAPDPWFIMSHRSRQPASGPTPPLLGSRTTLKIVECSLTLLLLQLLHHSRRALPVVGEG